MRRKRTIFNAVAMLAYLIIATICNFLIQRILISHYGSALMGVVSSITKFLSFITFFEAGIGGVIVASLYRPLAENSKDGISSIYCASNRFFRKIAYALIGYTLILGFILPRVTDMSSLNNTYVFLLTISIGISSFFQYYLCITYQLLLQAAQKQYVPVVLNIATVVTNTLIAAVVVSLNGDIIWVKSLSAAAYLIKPIILSFYCEKHFKIDKKVIYLADPIRNKWAGVGHHLAYFIHTSTDIAILTALGQYSNVTVYSIYATITGSLTSVIDCISNGIQAAFGNILASDEQGTLHRSFNVYELAIHICVTIVFGTAFLTILPFVHIYTSDLIDAKYELPLFAFLMILQEAMFCLRRPYLTIINAAGHYRETQKYAYSEAGINLFLSILLVKPLGMVGIAFGTFTAMVFRLLVSVDYLRNNILFRKASGFFRCLTADILSILIAFCIYRFSLYEYAYGGYIYWVSSALLTFILLAIVTVLLQWMINKNTLNNIFIEVKTTLEVLKKETKLI